MKKLSSILIAVLIILSAISVHAAPPASLNAGEVGNSVDLIVVKKPESKNSATMKKTYGVTGTGKNGVTVSYYKFNGSSYIAMKNSGGNIAQTTIGKAGLFYKQMSLSEGHNKFAVRAEMPGGAVQIVYFDINVLSPQILNNVMVFSSGIQSLYNGWMN